jgi:hypothetical protein
VRYLKLTWIFLALTLMAGCASLNRIELAQDALAGIRTIDVVVPPEPNAYSVTIENHPGTAVGGAIGAVIVIADQSSKEDRLKLALRAQHISVTGAMANVLTQRLTSAGYRVRLVEAQWDRQSLPVSVNVAAVNSDADALLVITPRAVGFIAGGALVPYEPTVTAEATLLGRDRKEVRYRGLHSAGHRPFVGEWRNVPARRTFENVDNLVENPAATASALDRGRDRCRPVDRRRHPDCRRSGAAGHAPPDLADRLREACL